MQDTLKKLWNWFKKLKGWQKVIIVLLIMAFIGSFMSNPYHDLQECVNQQVKKNPTITVDVAFKNCNAKTQEFLKYCQNAGEDKAKCVMDELDMWDYATSNKGNHK